MGQVGSLVKNPIGALRFLPSVVAVVNVASLPLVLRLDRTARLVVDAAAVAVAAVDAAAAVAILRGKRVKVQHPSW